MFQVTESAGLIFAGLLSGSLAATACATSSGDLGAQPGHGERILSVSWSPDGRRLASAGFDGTIRIWDAGSWTEQTRLETSSTYVLLTSWSPRGDRILGVTEVGLQVFDPSSGKELNLHATRMGPQADIAWSADGRLIALPGDDGSILLLDADGRENARLAGHTKEVSSVAWSSTGRFLASAGWDQAVRVWDVSAREAVRTWAHPGQGAIRVAWSPDASVVSAFTAVQPGVSLYSADGGASRNLTTVSGVTALAWTPGGSHLALGLADGTIEIRDALDGVLHGRLRCGAFVDSLAWSGCGRWLAAVGFGSSAVCLWDSSTGSERELRGHARPVFAIAWSPVGSWLASGGQEGKVRVWDVAAE